MPKRAAPIARIRLARSLLRLLLPPLVVSLAGAAAAAVGLLVVGGPLGIVLAVLGGAVVLGSLAGAAVLMSVRVEVEESAVGVIWLGGERVYPLTPGPVTRVRLRGENASRLRARTGALGWALGRARLRGEEEIEVVRLAPTRTAILVPTERGRLAIGAAEEDVLLEALSRAARARQRLEALADQVSPPAAPEARHAAEADEAEEVEPPAPPEPAPLTGIERALLEQRLAEERAAATAAELARQASGAAEPEPVAAEPEVAAPPPVEVVPIPQPRRRRVPRPTVFRRPRPSVALVALPLVGAGAAYAVGVVTGRMPPGGTDLARLTSLALVLAGPATSIGALMALAWWPRIVGVVVAGGLAASLFIGRALLG